ncbi:hypothetical protein AB0N38_14330 [Micromonospora aurantiaca]|uniref:hypothetical protein n=1 Tax=Micromonospora aurantiaca (nom. illeg.) TaxID=47850 RepID=UPI003443C5BA
MIAEAGPPQGATITYPTCPTCCTHNHAKEATVITAKIVCQSKTESGEGDAFTLTFEPEG